VLAALVLVVPVGLGAAEGVARAEQPAPGDAAASGEDAGAHFERGVGFFRDGDYTAAMVEFMKAIELDPRYPVLFNLGQTSKELKDYAAALTSFERYLSEGGDKIDPDRKKKVEGWIDELKGKVGRLSLKVNVEGADVVVDDISIGKTPLDKPIVMNAGRRKVAITKEGYAPLTRFVDVAGTEAKDLSLDLVSLAAPSGGGHGPPGGGGAPREEPSSPVAPGQWVMFGITAATGVAAGVVGGLALGKKGDFDDALKKVPTTSTEIDDARTSAKTFALAADVLTGVTAAAAVTTVVLFIVDASAGGSTSDAKPEAPKPTARVVVGPTFAGVTGSF
jgi:tetratricopeptide (TPR) repeat protein